MPPKDKITDHDLLIRIDERMENVEQFILKTIEDNQKRDAKIDGLINFKNYVKGSWAIVAIVIVGLWQLITGK